MNREEMRVARYRIGVKDMSADEQKAIDRALVAAAKLPSGALRMTELVADIGAARGREVMRRKSDERTEKARRGLVGARLPIEFVERVKVCAQSEGVSCYRFVADALMKACLKVENGEDG